MGFCELFDMPDDGTVAFVATKLSGGAVGEDPEGEGAPEIQGQPRNQAVVGAWSRDWSETACSSAACAVANSADWQPRCSPGWELQIPEGIQTLCFFWKCKSMLKEMTAVETCAKIKELAMPLV